MIFLSVSILIMNFLYYSFGHTVCDEGTFGPGCLMDCHCDVQCDRVTGHCPGQCHQGWFGDSCQSVCHCSVPCDTVTGHCPGDCEPGWTGDNCQQGRIIYLFLTRVKYA